VKNLPQVGQRFGVGFGSGVSDVCSGRIAL
jgi:hypothetical protein